MLYEVIMKQIRNSVFETNSSSSHSVNISSTGDIDTTLIPNEAGILIIDANTQFGWEQETYYDAETKAMYAYLQAQYSAKDELIDLVHDVIMKQTGASAVVFLGDIHSSWEDKMYSYIDHQSAYYESGFEPLESAEKLRNFIFNKSSYLETDNDNH